MCIKGLLWKLTIFVLIRDFKRVMAGSLNIIKSMELISKYLTAWTKKSTTNEKEIKLLSAIVLELSRFTLYHRRNELVHAVKCLL